MFDLALLWQAGFVNACCASEVHLTQTQVAQLSDRPDRPVFIAFDSELAGKDAACFLTNRLKSFGLNALIVDLPEGRERGDLLGNLLMIDRCVHP